MLQSLAMLRARCRSFSLDVANFQNVKLKSQESFYLHPAGIRVLNIYLFTIFQLNSVLEKVLV